jgi:hypothetical protein
MIEDAFPQAEAVQPEAAEPDPEATPDPEPRAANDEEPATRNPSNRDRVRRELHTLHGTS